MARSEAQKRADKKYEKKGQYSYAFLLRYARANRPEWFRCLCDNGTYVMKEYCKTAAFDARQAAR
jgi:hypothetical protein